MQTIVEICLGSIQERVAGRDYDSDMSSAFSESNSHRSVGDKDFQSFRNSLKESGRIDDSEREGLSSKLKHLEEEEKDKVPMSLEIEHRPKSSIANRN